MGTEDGITITTGSLIHAMSIGTRDIYSPNYYVVPYLSSVSGPMIEFVLVQSNGMCQAKIRKERSRNLFGSVGNSLYLRMTNTITMTPERKANMSLNKAKAAMFTLLAKGMTIDVNLGCYTNVTVEVQAIRDPKTDWNYADFKFNVKVIKGTAKTYKRDENMNRLKDADGRWILVDYDMKYVNRSKVNEYNKDIRRVVERELEKYAPMFSINQYRMKCDKVQWF